MLIDLSLVCVFSWQPQCSQARQHPFLVGANTVWMAWMLLSLEPVDRLACSATPQTSKLDSTGSCNKLCLPTWGCDREQQQYHSFISSRRACTLPTQPAEFSLMQRPIATPHRLRKCSSGEACVTERLIAGILEGPHAETERPA